LDAGVSVEAEAAAEILEPVDPRFCREERNAFGERKELHFYYHGH